MSYTKCQKCKGSGVIVTQQGKMTKCDTCSGQGVVPIIKGTLKSSVKNESLDFCPECEHHHCVCLTVK